MLAGFIDAHADRESPTHCTKSGPFLGKRRNEGVNLSLLGEALLLDLIVKSPFRPHNRSTALPTCLKPLHRPGGSLDDVTRDTPLNALAV